MYLLLYYFRETRHILHVYICQHSFAICELSLWTDFCVSDWAIHPTLPILFGVIKILMFSCLRILLIQWIEIQGGLCFVSFTMVSPTII